MTNFCSVCGASNDSTALYCVRCGASLAQNASAAVDWSNPFAPPPETTAFGGVDGATNDPNAPEIPGFVDALKICLLKKYADFSGRASLVEFGYFVLATILLRIALQVFSSALDFADSPGVGPANLGARLAIFGAAVSQIVLFLPSLAVLIRRLHDRDASGWNALWPLLPIVGSIVLLVLCIGPATPGPNRYGPAPWRRAK